MATPTVGIKRITIENFRGIDHLDLSFCNPRGEANQLVVLAGPNGSGKTAVLEACLLILGNSQLLPREVGKRDVRHGTKEFRIDAYYEGVEHYEHDWLTNADTNRPKRCECRYFQSWRSPSLLGGHGISVVGSNGRSQREENRYRRLKQRIVDGWARSNLASSSSKSKFVENIQRMEECWRQFYPEFDTRFIVDAESGEPDAKFDVFSLHEHAKISLDRLSSGQIEIFTFIGELVLQDSTPAIVVIDEPELHLDPQWHRVLMRTLTTLAPTTQFIVATHSSEVYASAMSFERHFLVPGDDPRARFWPKKEPVEAPEAG